MIKGIVPRSGIIDTDARWGFSHTKGWVFGYKLHMISSTGLTTIVPLAADFTTGNVQDNQMYNPMTSSMTTTTTTYQMKNMLHDRRLWLRRSKTI